MHRPIARAPAQLRKLGSARSISTNTTKKKAFPVPANVGILLGATAVQYGGLVYLAYRCEKDPDFEAYVDAIPYATMLLGPVREGLKYVGAVPYKNEAVQFEPILDKEGATTKESAKEMGEDSSEPDAVPVVEKEEAVDTVSETVVADVDVPVVVTTVDGEGKEKEDDEQSPMSEETADSVPVEVAAVDTPVEETVTLKVDEDEVSSSDTDMSVTSQTASIPVMPAEAIAKATESTVVKQALADSAQEYIALRRDLESTLLKDIHTLDENDLRIRIKQLATDMFERLAWADLKMAQSLTGAQSELTEKFTDLMHKQRAELEFELKRILFAYEQETAQKSAARIQALDEKYQSQLVNTVRAQAEGFQATLQKELLSQAEKITSELQDQLNNQVATLRKSQIDEMLTLQPAVQAASASLKAVQQVVNEAATSIKQTVDIHALSAAILSLEFALSNNSSSSSNSSNQAGASIAAHFSAVSATCAEDPVVKAVLSSFPPRVIEEGALPLSELQVRFNVMRDEVRKAALAPEAAPKMVGQLIGTVLATISWMPTGLVAGPGAEETLSRAAYYLERGKLTETLRELDGVKGYAQVLMKDWKDLARERLIVDQGIKVLKANAVLRHKAFV